MRKTFYRQPMVKAIVVDSDNVMADTISQEDDPDIPVSDNGGELDAKDAHLEQGNGVWDE